MVECALSETVATVSLSTVPRLSLAVLSFASEEADARGRAGGVAHLTGPAFTWDQMTQHLDDYRCSTEVRGSFQETAPRKTAENTVKHRDGGVGSVVANHRDGGCNNTMC